MKIIKEVTLSEEFSDLQYFGDKNTQFINKNCTNKNGAIKIVKLQNQENKES